MTTIIVVLIGIGVTFIASSLDCSPIRETFTKIVSNQQVDWSASLPETIARCQQPGPQGGQLPTGRNVLPPGQPSSSVAPDKNNQCPQGYAYYHPPGATKGRCIKF